MECIYVCMLTLALDGHKWSNWYPGHFTPRERTPSYSAWLGPMTSLDIVEKTKVSYPCQESKCSSGPQYGHYNNNATWLQHVLQTKHQWTQVLIFQNVMFCHRASNYDVLKHPASSLTVLRETTSLQHTTYLQNTCWKVSGHTLAGVT
jgi:hypothetical protein